MAKHPRKYYECPSCEACFESAQLIAYKLPLHRGFHGVWCPDSGTQVEAQPDAQTLDPRD